MSCFALVEECGFVFFELACGLADSACHVTHRLDVVLWAGVEPATNSKRALPTACEEKKPGQMGHPDIARSCGSTTEPTRA